MPTQPTAQLPRAFFARDTRLVARDLLGQVMVRLMADGARLAGRIVEVEAYRPDDAASHSFRGRTLRTQPMFGEAGHLYVYLIYGMHFCANIVTEAEDVGAAVLLRALEPIEGIEHMRQNYGRVLPDRDLCRGPGRLCKALLINRSDNGHDLAQPHGRLFIEHGSPIPDEQVITSPRIGVTGDDLARSVAWRWTIKDSQFVSGRPLA